MAASLTQTLSKVAWDNASSANGSFGSTPAAGSTVIVVAESWQGATSADFPSNGCTDNQGNTYTRAIHVRDAVAGASKHAKSVIYYCENVLSSGTFTITVTIGGTGNYGFFGAQEWAGLLTSGVLGETGSQVDDVTSPISSGSTGVLAQADNVIVTVHGINIDAAVSRTLSSEGGYTVIAEEEDYSIRCLGHAAYKIVSATTSEENEMTVGAGSGTIDTSGSVIAAFKVAGGAATAVKDIIGSGFIPHAR
jgi:hypothetical protein